MTSETDIMEIHVPDKLAPGVWVRDVGDDMQSFFVSSAPNETEDETDKCLPGVEGNCK